MTPSVLRAIRNRWANLGPQSDFAWEVGKVDGDLTPGNVVLRKKVRFGKPIDPVYESEGKAFDTFGLDLTAAPCSTNPSRPRR